jgi:hypothetical protein
MKIKRFIHFNLITEGLTKSTVGELSQELFGDESLTKTKYKQLEDKPVDVKTNQVDEGVEKLEINITEPEKTGGWDSNIPNYQRTKTGIYKLVFETKVDDKIFFYRFYKIIYVIGSDIIDTESSSVKGHKTLEGQETIDDKCYHISTTGDEEECYLDPAVIKMIDDKYKSQDINNLLKRFK